MKMQFLVSFVHVFISSFFCWSRKWVRGNSVLLFTVPVTGHGATIFCYLLHQQRCAYFWVLYYFMLCYIILTHLLTPWCRVLLEQLTGLQLVKKFPAFHGTRRFITALTSVRHLSLSWASPIQSIFPHPTSWRSILILSTHLRLGLPSGLLLSGFPTKTLYNPLSSPIRATCSAHLIYIIFIYCNWFSTRRQWS